jgi:hypothetical protein
MGRQIDVVDPIDQGGGRKLLGDFQYMLKTFVFPYFPFLFVKEDFVSGRKYRYLFLFLIVLSLSLSIWVNRRT